MDFSLWNFQNAASLDLMVLLFCRILFNASFFDVIHLAYNEGQYKQEMKKQNKNKDSRHREAA